MDRHILDHPSDGSIFNQFFGARRDQRLGPLLGQQTVAVERVDRRRFHRHRAPVSAQFVSENLRQNGIDTLSHFALRHDHRDLSVFRYFQKCTENLLIVGRGDIGCIAARPKCPGHHQTTQSAASDQEFATIQSGVRSGERLFAPLDVRFNRHKVSLSGPGGECRFSDSGP